MKPLNLRSYFILAKIGIYVITVVLHFWAVYGKILKVVIVPAQINS